VVWVGGGSTKKFEFFVADTKKEKTHTHTKQQKQLKMARRSKFVDDEAVAGDSPSPPASPSYLPASPPPLDIDFTLSERDHFKNLLHLIANNFDQHVVDLLSAKPKLASLVDSGRESALYHALKEKYTSERIIYALIRAGPFTFKNKSTFTPFSLSFRCRSLPRNLVWKSGTLVASW